MFCALKGNEIVAMVYSKQPAYKPGYTPAHFIDEKIKNLMFSINFHTEARI